MVVISVLTALFNLSRSTLAMTFLLGIVLWTSLPAGAAVSRIKDIVAIEGIRENQLIGYGLVVGLDGSGDILLNAPFTEQSLNAMLERLGVNTKGIVMRTENVAAVIVTATLPSFARQGTRIDVSVNSIGDAEQLMGGTLLATPLMGADGQVYAVAQGSVAVAGFAAGGDAAAVTQGVPTAGRISNGAIVEREVDFALADLRSIKLALNNPDFTTSRRVAAAINAELGDPLARAVDPSTVVIDRPVGYARSVVDIITDVENLVVETDQRAKVIIDERTGIIVMGSEVKIDSVAIAQGSLTISITENPIASQPQPFADGETVVLPRTGIDVDDGRDNKLGLYQANVSLQELVDGLNALGVGPRDMISILQAVKAAGAIQAELLVY